MAPATAVLHGRQKPFNGQNIGADKTSDEVRISLSFVWIETHLEISKN